MSKLIEDYALLGDGETAALLASDGSIDWLCWPRFDDDACFAALLGTDDHGHWTLAPADGGASQSRRYQDDTLVMETDFQTPDGRVRIIDFMPVRTTFSSLVRIVVGLQGIVKVRSDVRLRFDYGALAPWSVAEADAMIAKVGPNLIVLRASVKLSVSAESTVAEFEVSAGERVAFVMSYENSHERPPAPIDAEAALVSTQRFWRDWIGRFDNAMTDWPVQVRRSLITLKALIHRRSGGLVAAPTTSLPEAPGGGMNWDYRYCWLRDASFTLTALLNAGYHEEAEGWRNWLLRAIAGSPDKLRIMYRVDGSRHLPEWGVDALPGYRFAKPVRVGNAASTQHQLDVYGEVLDCVDLASRGGVPPSDQEFVIERRLVEHLETIWRTRGSGVWESRAEPCHYTYSKVMVWVAFDRFVSRHATNERVSRGLLSRITELRQTVRDEIYREAWNEGLGTFTQHYGAQTLDASLLLLPLVGFLPVENPRMASTIATIERELVEGGLVRRKKANADGPNEGAFLACSCWMAECMKLQGRDREAREQFERLLAVANDVGLLAEEYNVPGRHLAGNFPQALTHLSIVNAALALSGPTLRRGGKGFRE
ncbi:MULTISPECIES: glycoside hydrolase family 15 protein [unclassified Paraburkholderia]|uniref:glycoside hydrolase family 15 protein n=1 Tax=unclassified Paraburkholderia TaxID=2615204 RepID=UPI000E284AE3|nr:MULTISPECIES: glycoside hydrolase family 15 protein [unclassified Paraburkholderia]REE21509.1 GH15 family glucan-1,4-alpha-glucosidase [Paraburkholderia sp. BL27I4N3]RKR38646.1 GH15 family glucan-1,4-alpha-glucosidase [Paraburkholderia sp. BL17N1]